MAGVATGEAMQAAVMLAVEMGEAAMAGVATGAAMGAAVQAAVTMVVAIVEAAMADARRRWQ